MGYPYLVDQMADTRPPELFVPCLGGIQRFSVIVNRQGLQQQNLLARTVDSPPANPVATFLEKNTEHFINSSVIALVLILILLSLTHPVRSIMSPPTAAALFGNIRAPENLLIFAIEPAFFRPPSHCRSNASRGRLPKLTAYERP
jgi:hypothetical protein